MGWGEGCYSRCLFYIVYILLCYNAFLFRFDDVRSHVQLPLHCEVRASRSDPSVPGTGGDWQVRAHIPIPQKFGLLFRLKPF